MSAVGKGIAVGAIAAAPYVNNITTPYLGVSLHVVVGACIGALAGLAWGQPEASRRKVFQIAAGSVIAGCAIAGCVTLVLKYVYHIELTDELSPLALVVALFGRVWVPAVDERIGPWLDRIPFIGKKGG